MAVAVVTLARSSETSSAIGLRVSHKAATGAIRQPMTADSSLVSLRSKGSFPD
jgi:hypothetical protein